MGSQIENTSIPAKAQASRLLKVLSVIVGIAGLCIFSVPITTVYCVCTHTRLMFNPLMDIVAIFAGGWMAQMPHQVFRRYSGKPISYLWLALIIAALVYSIVLAMLAETFNLL